jgi:hypothetical protein
MTKDIVRFIDHPDSANERSFSQLFGSLQCREEWKALQGLEREEAIVATYCDRIRTSGNFKFAVSAVVLNPQVDRSHYHLIYATRHPEGLVTFRNEERAALPVQSSLRAGVKDRMRRTKDATGLLFGPEAVDTPFVERLRARYRTRATERALGRRVSGDRIRFDEFAWSLMEVPMIAEKDVKEIVAELQRQSVLTVEGLPPRKRVPGLGEDHFIRWR